MENINEDKDEQVNEYLDPLKTPKKYKNMREFYGEEYCQRLMVIAREVDERLVEKERLKKVERVEKLKLKKNRL